MARDYDSQLLESVAVRRQRLREAVLFGSQRTRRRLDESIVRVVISLCLAAVACAGTVGWSFVSSQLRAQEEEQEQAAAGPPNVAPPAVPADWVGAQVTLPMLREELDRSGVPPELYVLPGDPRPPAGSVASYYLLTEETDDLSSALSVGIIEFDQGRTGAEFTSVDEAARWLHQQLVTVDTEPERLTPEEEAQATQLTSELTEEVRGELAGGGDSHRQALAPGQVVDAFGPESGSLLFPDAVPFAQRGLPEYVRTGPEAAATGPGTPRTYHRYRVIHPFQVTASISPGAEQNPGGGLRFTVEPGGFSQPVPLPSIRWLLVNGYLERVAVTDVPG